ncbi:hypothetical protein [Pseudarthrobacter sp. B4EP4b]|uniref:5' nucleotidase, NT5C type n=1 Tax=Pseudarthrobacter sp. B4EP4b TaxID=2590664 RepID=UPI0011505F6A|nr:hypothetical protein [Pseudarthrobacter sp. B4EP4b]
MPREFPAAVRRFIQAHGRAPVVLVDMDEVLCRWEEQFVASHRRLFPHLLIAEAGQRESFDLFAGLTTEEQQATATVLDEPGFFAGMLPVKGALAAVEEMLAAGVDVALCTSPWLSNATCASDKLRWVQRYLGPAMAEATVITRDKTRVRGDVLIDDKPFVTGQAQPEWDLVRFTYHYNRHLPGPRIDGWSDWQPVLSKILDMRTQRAEAAQIESPLPSLS